MVTSVVLPYERFSQIAEIEISHCVEVTVSLGCAEFAKRDIPSYAGPFPVHLSLKTAEGRFLGNGAYPGMVYGFDQDVLEQLWNAANETLNEDELYITAMDCNEGDYLDENGQGPVCSDCLIAAGEFYGEEDDESGDRPVIATPNPTKGQACWSCQQMIDERIQEAARTYEEVEA